MKKAVIFDFDYTLGDSTNGIVKSALYALEKMGEKNKTEKEIINTIGLSLEETYRVLTNKENTENEKLFRKYFIEKADEVMVKSTSLYENTVFVLENLKKENFKTAIVTTKLNSRIKRILQKFDISDLIDVIVGVEDVKKVKPDPEGLFLALEKLCLKKEEVFYIGDSFVDAEASQNANIDFLGILTGTTSKEVFLNYSNKGICKDIKQAYNLVINNREEKYI